MSIINNNNINSTVSFDATGACTMAKFAFNPHHHVKIWLSKNQDSFLNPLNQLRLVRMRVKNPDDTIHFVYDSRLLSKKALTNLNTFCKKHDFKPIDVYTQITPACQTIEEKKLITLYEDEILHLNEGGNLAAASDILRFLSPVYSLGTYSDFDVEINTAKLPASIPVKEPVLMNLTYEPVIYFCNDIVAVVTPSAALEHIQIIQRAMIEACAARTTGYVTTFNPELYFTVLNNLQHLENPTEQQKELIEYLTVLLWHKRRLEECLSLGYSVREFRHIVCSKDISSFIHDERCTFQHILDMDPPIDESNFDTNHLLANIVIKLSIVNSSGSEMFLQFMHCLQTQCPEKFLNNRYLGIGLLSNYQLDKAYIGQNFRKDQPSDLSWLEFGQEQIREKERQMNESAKKLQQFFRRKEYKKNNEAESPPTAKKPDN